MHFPIPNHVMISFTGRSPREANGNSTAPARSDLRRIAIVTAAALAVLWLVSLIIGVIALGSVAAPYASNCAAQPIEFRPGTITDAAMAISGKRSCMLAVRRGSATIDRLAIETPPTQGQLRPRGHLGVVYEPARDFSGSDAFALTMTGTRNSERGTMLIRVTVGH